jgi:Protein of unknown function (DUF3147)
VRPSLNADALRETAPPEYAVRFLFGGAMTAIAGLIAHACGPAVGGLFLAFPAILPASLTLVARHGGREKAVSEARGAILGAFALAAFAAIVCLLAMHKSPALTLTVATVAWLGVAMVLWSMMHGRA